MRLSVHSTGRKLFFFNPVPDPSQPVQSTLIRPNNAPGFPLPPPPPPPHSGHASYSFWNKISVHHSHLLPGTRLSAKRGPHWDTRLLQLQCQHHLHACATENTIPNINKPYGFCGCLPCLLTYWKSHSSGAVWELRWPSCALRPNELSGFRGRKELLNHASALVSACP